ncbi:AAA family ATPase [Streptomyces sp. NPDC001536]|uniref:AAA family ATPase n=1 Tax=Streptomyces sp. NPDC001536 TaxID=3364583 RepID=UPI0036948DBE
MAPTTAPAPPTRLNTRKPTGRIDWPLVVAAGAEKTGKSHLCAEFANSDLIGRLIWIPIGESDVDSFGQIADFDIADEHDGTYRGILNTVRAAVAEPRTDPNKPNAIVLDSGTILWELLQDEADLIARSRAAEKAAKYKRPGPSADDDVVIGHGLWNRAKDRWRHVINALRRHDGPVIICCRLDEVTEFDAQGNPTRNRTWKVKSERSLPYDATVVLQLRSYRRPTLTAVRSLVMQLAPDEERARPGLTLDGLMRELGMERNISTPPTPFIALQPEAGLDEFEREAELRVAANAAAAEMRRHSAEGTLPTPQDVTENITRALRDPNDPIAALLMVRTAYTAAVLQQVIIPTRQWGETDADTAITRLRADLSRTANANRDGTPVVPPQRQASAATPNSPSPGRDEGEDSPGGEEKNGEQHLAVPQQGANGSGSPTPPTGPAPGENEAPPPVDQGRRTAAVPRRKTRQETQAERVREAVDKEAGYQARVLSVGLHEHLADLLPASGDVEDINTYDLTEFVKSARPSVLEALVTAGEAATISAYAQVPDGPCMSIDEVFDNCQMLKSTPS